MNPLRVVVPNQPAAAELSLGHGHLLDLPARQVLEQQVLSAGEPALDEVPGVRVALAGGGRPVRELERAGWGWWTARVCGALMVWSWWSSRGLLRRKAK